MSAVNEIPRQAAELRATSTRRRLQITFWIIAILLGGIQSWATRFTMNPDGISYLDIGDAYWRGDWHNAINGYWSPLYSWILGLALKIVKPSIYGEYPLAHLLNFLIYVAALASFELFLTTFIQSQRNTYSVATETESAIDETSWRLLGYGLFISSCVLMIGTALVTPDMCVAGFVFLAAALVLRVREGSGRSVTYLGLVLGLGYLSKAVMFPLGFVFLVVAFWRKKSKPGWKDAAIAALVFLGSSAPFIAALSYSQGKLTFGEVGPIAYEVYVNNVDQFIPEQSGLRHPVRKILDSPPTYDIGQSAGGTYSLWFDPTYWHAGLKPRWDINGQLHAIHRALLLFFLILTSFQLNIATPFITLLLIGSSPKSSCKRIFRCWPLILPSAAAIALYSLVYSETRYLAPFLLLLWMSGFSGLRFTNTPAMKKFVFLAMVAVVSTTIFFIGYFVLQEAVAGEAWGPVYARAARALYNAGVKPGDRLAVVATDPVSDGGAFVARLLRAKIVAQSEDVSGDWVRDANRAAQFDSVVGKLGVKAVLWHGDTPKESVLSWKRLEDGQYYVHLVALASSGLIQRIDSSVSVAKDRAFAAYPEPQGSNRSHIPSQCRNDSDPGAAGNSLSKPACVTGLTPSHRGRTG